MTARLVRWLLDRFGGDVRLALAAYAVGPGAVSRAGVSPEVDRSVQQVLERRTWFA